VAEYTLPDLDWDYAALEPHISGQINEIHHSKHHATYVKGVNDAVANSKRRVPKATTPRSS
jgi:Fe-Mn family superoxide dismutase